MTIIEFNIMNSFKQKNELHRIILEIKKLLKSVYISKSKKKRFKKKNDKSISNLISISSGISNHMIILSKQKRKRHLKQGGELINN